MRRKLFFCVTTLVFIIFFMDSAGLLERPDTLNHLYGTESTYTGKVLKIQHTVKAENSTGNTKQNIKDVYKFILRLDSGEKIMISYYGNIEDIYIDMSGKNIKNNSNPQECFASVIKFKTELQKPSGKRNPNCFDYAKYLKSIDVDAVGTVKKIEVIAKTKNPVERLNRLLLIKKENFKDVLPEESKGIVSGLLFGDTEYLYEDIYEEFRSNGTAHVLAVSGLHIGVIYRFVIKIFGRRQSKLTFVIILLILYAFGCLASWNASVVRAIGMVMLRMFALYTDRRYDLLNGASFVALLSIANNPYVVFNTGFQMSYLAIVSISFCAPRIPTGIPGVMAQTLAVNLGMIPYQMFVFNTLSVTSLFANIPVVYITSMTIPFVAIRFVCFVLGLNIAPLNLITDSLAWFCIKVNSLTTLGKDSLDVISPNPAFIILVYLIIFIVISETFEILVIRKKYKQILLIFCGFVLVIILVYVISFEPISGADMIFVDVGQGDCIHIRTDDRNILIDGGGNIGYEVGAKTLKPYLLKNGVLKVDLALATHLHTDHYKGLAELENEDMIRELRTKLTAGQSIRLEDVMIETLWPLDIDEKEGQDENKDCSVFLIHYGGYKVMITGDLDSEGEKKMIEYYKSKGRLDKLQADILKVGHHGSKTSTSKEFLDMVKPSCAVIQVGKNNYGHPSDEVLERLDTSGSKIFRSDKDGAIGFYFEKSRIKAYVMQKHR